MRICGLNKTTILDYPGKVAATVFLGGCNFRCPFCQNGSLVLAPQEEPEIPMEELWAFLKRRKGILDGVCVTGGEPTLAAQLPEFLGKIKELGYLVKLDTNGTRPEVIEELLKNGLVDYIAMDIKTSREQYKSVAGTEHLDMEKICRSVQLIMDRAPDYEFRTTVVKELHSREDFQRMGEWLKGAKVCYLQAYRDSEEVIRPGFSSYSREEMEEFAVILRRTIPLVQIRGLD
ncbi:MAG: anaerobic ribonucleoside-triphosphate reductase activating protein [Eubacteriales bacterium]|nr:anaerobic ribonucleoside-triphosphate reductase activating protein [Eubacteriales bacterium]